MSVDLVLCFLLIIQLIFTLNKDNHKFLVQAFYFCIVKICLLFSLLLKSFREGDYAFFSFWYIDFTFLFPFLSSFSKKLKAKKGFFYWWPKIFLNLEISNILIVSSHLFSFYLTLFCLAFCTLFVWYMKNIVYVASIRFGGRRNNSTHCCCCLYWR